MKWAGEGRRIGYKIDDLRESEIAHICNILLVQPLPTTHKNFLAFTNSSVPFAYLTAILVRLVSSHLSLSLSYLSLPSPSLSLCLSACALQLCNLTRAVDVAVLDELQMLGDEDRGSNWTRALLGIPAAEVCCTVGG